MRKHIFIKNGLLEAIFQEPVVLDNTGGVGGIWTLAGVSPPIGLAISRRTSTAIVEIREIPLFSARLAFITLSITLRFDEIRR